MNRSDDFHCFRPVSPEARWESIATVLEAEPAAWDWALENIERWLAQRRLHPTPLLEWRQRLLQCRREVGERHALLETFRHPPANAHEAQLRSCSPFLGGPFQAASPLASVS